MARVHRHRLGPTEDRRAGDREQQGQRHAPHRVDMRDGVEREAAGTLGGVVAEREGDDAVRHLVQDDRGDEHGQAEPGATRQV